MFLVEIRILADLETSFELLEVAFDHFEDGKLYEGKIILQYVVSLLGAPL